MNAGNVVHTNALLNGACDDDDNELTEEEQKKVIEERLKALQARFKAFEEKTLKQKIDELILANKGIGMTEKEAEMALRVCNNNEFEASDRLTEEDEGDAFIAAIRSMVRDEAKAERLKGRGKKLVEERLEKRRKRLRRRRDVPDDSDDENARSDDDVSDWESDPDEEPVQEVEHGFRYIRHAKKHSMNGQKRLRLDDALAAMKKKQEEIEAAKAAAAAEAPAPAANGGSADDNSGSSSPEKDSSGDEGGKSGGAADGDAETTDAADDLLAGWSDARLKAWNNRANNENAYYYRFNAPGEAHSTGGWSTEEAELFMKVFETKEYVCPVRRDYKWGMFSKSIPGQVGYQCSNYYRTLITQGKMEDPNYMVDEDGKLRFGFKDKGFERAPGVPKPPKPPKAPKEPKQPKAKKPKAPKAKKAKKSKWGDESDMDKSDKNYTCSVKFDAVRKSSRGGGAKKYTDGYDEDDFDDEDESPVLPGFIDPLTKMQIEEPTISPYGHVAGYETWCRVLRDPTTKDTCPFTRQPLKRRELVKLTHENIVEYREKMVETQTN